ncbi:MAG: T9SS type A sorting domain-containing protein [Candidatus Kapaibacterium sp.]
MKKLFTTLLFLMAVSASGQWQPDVRLTNSPWNSYTSENIAWCIASSGNDVHIVWYDDRDGNYEIYYKRSSNGGTTWGSDTRLTNDTAYSGLPAIAVSGSNINVVWEDTRNGNNEIYYKRTSDGGINWGADTRLTYDSANSRYPSAAVTGTIVQVVWREYRDGNDEIYYKRSTDGGINWGADTRLTNNGSSSWYPSIAVFDTYVHVVWNDVRNGNNEIYYKRSTNGGINWGADIRMTNDIALSYKPSIAVNGLLVHIVWEENRDQNSEIYYKRSIDGGINWGSDTRLTNSFSSSILPSIAVTGSLLHVVWTDIRDGNREIYYKRSTDDGINWVADIRLTNDGAYSEYPSIASSGTLVHTVWNDTRDGNREIYYKRNPTGNVDIKNISLETPSKYSLSQNYPNPFNPMTNVKFSIVKSGDVKMVVYDIQGREVRTLVNESLKPGTYEAAFDGSQLVSGVYFYKISAGDFSDTKKMVLIK